MLNKQQVLLALLAALAAAIVATMNQASAAIQSDDWNFQVLLNDKPIGYHSFSLTQDGEQQTLRTEARFDVKVLFINAYRYRHENTEVWSDGCLSSIDAFTDSNGEVLTVRGKRYAEGLELTGRSGPSILDECVQTFAYWNPEILNSSRLLNSQTGELEDVSVTLESRDEIAVDGQRVDALRYRLAAKSGAITLWYTDDESPRWVALEAPAKGGRTIRYVPVQIPATNPA